MRFPRRLPSPRVVWLALPLIAASLVAAGLPFPGNVERQEVLTGPTRHAVWIDLEGDGDGDLAIADDKNVVRILRNDNGTFSELAGAPRVACLPGPPAADALPWATSTAMA